MMATCAPSCASAWQIRCPSPPLPPVTSVTTPFRSIASFLHVNALRRAYDDGALMRQHRPRIARVPAVRLHQREETLDHLVEQRRLFQIEHVARLRKKCQPRCGKVFLQKET